MTLDLRGIGYEGGGGQPGWKISAETRMRDSKRPNSDHDLELGGSCPLRLNP